MLRIYTASRTRPRPRMSSGRVLTELAVVDSSTSVRPASVARVVANLALFRCPECEHDYVLDLANDEAWDLDPTDYTDAGSYDVHQARTQSGTMH